MKIKQITCENVKGIPNGIYQTSETLTVISGPNGSGKTTLLDLIQYLLTGGTLPDRFVKNGTKKAIFSLLTEHNGTDTEISISKTATEGSQITFKLNGKTSSLKKIQEYISACDGTGKIIRYSDVLNNLKPKELADLLFSYIPEQSSKSTILSYMKQEYTSKDPESETTTTFNTDDISQAKKILEDILPDTVTRQELISALDTCTQKKNELLKQLKSVSYSLRQLQALNIDPSSLRSADIITKEINEIQALKTNADMISKAWLQYQSEAQHVKEYNEKLQALYSQIQQFVAPEPDEKEAENLNEMQSQWTEYKRQIENQITASGQTLKFMQDGLEKLNTAECPLSKKLCCTTDKSAVKNELENNIRNMSHQINQMKSNLTQAETNLQSINTQLKQMTDAKALFLQRQSMISSYNQMLSVKPNDPVPPVQQPINVSEINQKLALLQQEQQTVQRYLQMLQLKDQYISLIKQYHINNYLVKELDPKGSIMKGIMDKYVIKLNGLISDKVSRFSPDWSIGFVFDNGLVPTASINKSEYMPYPLLSSGEKAIVALFITDMLNSLDRKEIVDQTTGAVSYTGIKTLLIDGLEKLDVKNFAYFINALNQPAIHDSYDNIVINIVNHTELINQVLGGNRISLNK